MPAAAIARRDRRLSRGEVLSVPWPDLAAGVALALAAVADISRRPDAVHPWTELVAALAVGSLALRTRAPLAMAVGASVFISVYAVLPAAETPLWAFVGVLLVSYSTGAHLAGRRRWAALGLLLLSGYLLQLASLDRAEPSDHAFSEVWLSPLVIIGAPAAAGALLARSRRQTAELRVARAELEAQREQQAAAAAAAERERIARELHDVISHSVSVMVVQAGALEQLLPAGSPARARVRTVRETGREALAELRRQLAVLRHGREEDFQALPGLVDLEALTARSGASLETPGGLPPDVPPGVALTAYRVVQEALTNASRYATGARVTVHLAREADELTVRVEDTGGAAASNGVGSGQGVPGMRQRVEMYGGRFDTGPHGTGWRVQAAIPLHPPAPAGERPAE